MKAPGTETTELRVVVLFPFSFIIILSSVLLQQDMTHTNIIVQFSFGSAIRLQLRLLLFQCECPCAKILIILPLSG